MPLPSPYTSHPRLSPSEKKNKQNHPLKWSEGQKEYQERLGSWKAQKYLLLKTGQVKQGWKGASGIGEATTNPGQSFTKEARGGKMQ